MKPEPKLKLKKISLVEENDINYHFRLKENISNLFQAF